MKRSSLSNTNVPERAISLDSHHWEGSMLHSVDDLMPIGEFSDRSGLSAKRLRTYAAEGLLTPAAVDPGSGYRYYSPGQLADARVIDALRQAGVAARRHSCLQASSPPQNCSMPGRDSSKLMRTTAREPSPSPVISSQETNIESHERPIQNPRRDP